MFISASNVSPISYKIGQKIEEYRLMQRCTQAELASKIGLAYQEVNSYEQGYIVIPIEVLYIIARVLSVDAVDLLPKPITVREHEDEDEEILYLTKIYERGMFKKVCQSAFLVQLNFQSIWKENIKLRHS
ncbi:helix-turn-helix domain-containing protein [Wolbachia endosymbiont (group A) of Bombylius major]|uniref:helix-turn-helix domain-containing protein n=1 Tax=Wolbachia endosymbiont (group A) of Bombylius major TaxID=2953988 RepID=UPI00222EF979|nr:helix-turn-helix transcriptional regulator [Wolbachia endosymbiont (group A) of Bombylius major]